MAPIACGRTDIAIVSSPRMPGDVALRATIWGARGSLATPGEATVGFGGNTSCIEVRTSEGGLLVLDAGTGIKQLGAALEHDRRSGPQPRASGPTRSPPGIVARAGAIPMTVGAWSPHLCAG